MVLAEASSFLQSGITAARSGNRLLARMHLEAALHQNRHDAEAWLWLAWTADSPAHAISCLEWVLAFDPDNSLAQAGLDWIRRLEACPFRRTVSLSDGDAYSPWNSSDRLEAYPAVGELTELIDVDDSFAEDLSEPCGLDDIDERVSSAQALLDEIDDPWDGMRSNDFASDHGITDVADLIDAVTEAEASHRFEEVDDESFDLLCKEIEADEAEWPFDVAEMTIVDDVSGCESLAVTDHTICELLDDANAQAQLEDTPCLEFSQSTETSCTEPELFETSADVEPPVGEVEPDLAEDPSLDVLFTLDEPVAELSCDPDELPEWLDESNVVAASVNEPFEIPKNSVWGDLDLAEWAIDFPGTAEQAVEINESAETETQTAVEVVSATNADFSDDSGVFDLECPPFDVEDENADFEGLLADENGYIADAATVLDDDETLDENGLPFPLAPVAEPVPENLDTASTAELEPTPEVAPLAEVAVAEMTEADACEAPVAAEDVCQDSDSVHQDDQADVSFESAARQRILVVDDSITVRKLVSLTLTKAGFEVLEAEDGVTALRDVALQQPDLVLADINMPKLDGYRLCRLVKSHEATKHIPVVLVSGLSGEEHQLRGKLVGCDAYVTKPVVPEAVLEVVLGQLAVISH